MYIAILCNILLLVLMFVSYTLKNVSRQNKRENEHCNKFFV